MSALFRTSCLSLCLLPLFPIRAIAQCTTCDGDVKVKFKGSMCHEGSYTFQLYNETLGPVTGTDCGYTLSPEKTVKLKPDKRYTLTITAIPSGSNGGTTSIHAEVSAPSCFDVYIDGEKTSVFDDSGPGCGTGQGYSRTLSILIKGASSGGSGSGGEGDVSGGSSSGGLSGNFSLGGSKNGSAGSISFSSGTISPDLFTPAVLNYESISLDVDVIRDSGTHVLRQIKAPEVLADIITLSATSYEVKFYPSAQVLPKTAGIYPVIGDPSAGLYPATGNPSRVWRISSPSNSAATPEIKVAEIRGAVETDWVFSFISGTWLAQTSGVRAESRAETTLGNGDKQIETTVFHPTSGLVASKVREVYHAFPWGTEKTSSVEDPGGDALTTTWTYHEIETDPANYTRLKWVIQPDGSWQRYDYNEPGTTFGKINHIYRPWKGLPALPATATETNCHLTTYYYSSPGYSYFATEVSQSDVQILGVVAKESYNWPYADYLDSWYIPIFEDFPDMEDLAVIIRTEGGYYGRKTATISATSEIPEYLRGRLAYIQEADGRQEIHAYQKGDYNPSTQAFSISSTGGDLREFTYQVTSENPEGIDEKSLQTVRTTGIGGNLLKEEVLVKAASGYVSLGSTFHGYDTSGHLILTTSKGRVTYEASWVNGRLATETDEQGITTTYDVYDAEGRVTQETRSGVVTNRVFDPAGNLKSTTRGSGGLSLATSTGYDISGRVISETSEDGLITGTGYTSGGRIATRTLADTSTEITTRYLDGQTQSITGTGVVARYFNYGTDANGFWTKESIGSETSPRYSQNWRTDEGETWLAAVSGPSGPIYTQTTFDPYIDGRRVSQTVPGEAQILFGYDPDTRSLVRQARDLNANDVIDDDTDAIGETNTSYIEESGNWFRQTTSSRYETDGNATPTVLSTTREQLTGLGAGVASVTESIDPQGNITTRTTVIDRSTRTVTVTTDVPDSNLDAVEISIDGLLRSATTSTVAAATLFSGYDALGRPTEVTSPRGVVATTVYDPVTGRISSATRAGKTTFYDYHLAGGPGAGKISTTTLPDTKVIRTSYSLRGEVSRVWGGATYPLEHTYDGYGQQQFLKTYRGGTGWTSATWPASPGTADTTEWTYYEATGLLHQKLDAASKATTYTYQAASGKLQTSQLARGPVTTYTWNSLGFPESTTYSDTTPSLARTYDRAGRMKTLADAAGTHEFTYPDRLATTETITGGILGGVSRTATLDTFGRLHSTGATSGTAGHSSGYSYAGDSRLEIVTTGTETATYGYLADSDAIETLTFKSGSTTRLATTRNHDAYDRLDGVTNAYGSQTQSFGVTEFDNMNRRKKIEREDGTRWAYGYNSKGEVTSGLREKTASPNAPVPGWDHSFTFDEIGNRITATTNARVSTYVPNALNQYDSRTVPRAFDVIGKANAAASVTVDGNPATRLDEFFYKELAAGSGAIHTPYVVQATDANGTTTRSGGKFLSATPEVFGHDFDGNLTSDGRFTYTWDAENRLAAMETHATIPLPARRKLAFSYDAMGRRIRKTVWHGTGGGGWQLHHQFDFVHELGGWNILAERSGGSSNSFLRTYAWGTDLSGGLSGAGGVGGMLFCNVHTSGKTIAYGSDLNGNVTLLVDTTSGQAAASYDYGPFGELLRQSGEYASLNPFRFSTKYTDDETGHIDYGNRHYDPVIGRWLNRDPIEENGGVNLYRFVDNGGVNKIDRLGLFTLADARASLIRRKVLPALTAKNDQYSHQQIFDEWYSLETTRGKSWLASIPKCPRKLCVKQVDLSMGYRLITNPDRKKWNDPGEIVKPFVERFHPGAFYEMRSKNFGGHSNQCTYDSAGDIITSPPAMGTVDFAASNTMGHWPNDVETVIAAATLDGQWSTGWFGSVQNLTAGRITGVGANLNKYFEVRPSHHENQ